MQSACVSIRHPDYEKFPNSDKLDPEIVLEQLYRSGEFKKVRSIKKYYPKSLTEKEIIEKTKLPSKRVSMFLKFYLSEKTNDEPIVKEIKVKGITKYKLTESGVVQLSFSVNSLC